MAGDTKLDSYYGAAQPGQQDAPQGVQQVPLVGKEAGAKTLQSATFGFGADAVSHIVGKQAGDSIRQMSAKYDKDHPLASFGIDLAVAAAESAIPVGGEAAAGRAAMSGARALGGQVVKGAAVGAATGAGAGGDMGERAKHAAEGGTLGALASLGLGGAGLMLKPVFSKGFSQAKAAADTIKQALQSEGKTVADLNTFMLRNPNARIADFSDKVASLVGKAGGKSDATAVQLARSLTEDLSGQAGRIQTQSTPLINLKQQMVDNLKNLEAKRADTYSKAYAEVVPLTPELKSALDHPDIKPMVDNVLKDYRDLRGNPSSAVAKAPKYNVDKEIPSAVIDDLQKRLGDAAKDPAAMGKMRAGVLQHAQSLLKDSQSDVSKQAQALAAKVGGVDSQTGIKGAQDWGAQYAFGLGTADVAKFHDMSPLEKQYARLGMVDGMERYLNEKTRMPEGSLRKIADTMNDPKIREVLGPKDANAVKKAFAAEAARAQTSTTMQRGGSHQAAFHEKEEERTLGHIGNTIIPGGGHFLGSTVRYLKNLGMPEERAKAIIDIATKPGGIDRLKQAGVSQKVLDAVSALNKQKGTVGARLTEDQQLKARD